MHAVTIPEPGPPDVLTWAEVDDPEPGPGEVVIDVAASAVNRADLMQRQGHYPPPRGASPYPGLECSGTISALGDGVTGLAVGDQVTALLAGGGYAERVAVPAAQVLPAPRGVDLVEAAGLPEVACTVWSNVVQFARLAADEVLLVHGGSGGIGTHAIQIGAALGARVAVTASARNHDVCRDLGADVTIDYREQDFVDEVRRATDGRGADVVLDNMGAKYFARNVDVLAPDGRLVIIGFQGGATTEVDLRSLMAKRAVVTSTGLRGRPTHGRGGKAEVVDAVARDVWPMIEEGRVRPVTSDRIPMRDAARAHELLERGGSVVGKLLLVND